MVEWGKTIKMGLWQDIKYRIKKSWLLILPVMIFSYFGFYAFCGERGYQKYLYLQKEVEYAKTIANQYQHKKEVLNAEVRMLSPGSLDLDMLDERARMVLNLAGDGEFVILDDEK